MVPIPEHEKLTKISAQSQLCGEFVELLLDTQKLRRTQKPFNLRKELAQFFHINEDKLEAEKRAMLKDITRNG